MQEKQAELGVTMSAYNNTSDKWVNCTDKFNLNAYLDITKDSTVSGVTNELILRPYTYNSTVWSQAAQTFFADAWADTSKMEQSCKGLRNTDERVHRRGRQVILQNIYKIT